MAAKLVKTKTPGIYKRGNKYVIRYRDRSGVARWESAANAKQARDLQSKRLAAAASGELEERSRVTLRDYATEWIERYHGTGKRGFREETRSEYRGLLKRYALRY